MKTLSLVLLFFSFQSVSNEKTRQLDVNGSKVMTTYEIDSKFLGKYMGSKKGYLLLDSNGNGTYRYDYPGISPDCSEETIVFKWGFILDENGVVV